MVSYPRFRPLFTALWQFAGNPKLHTRYRTVKGERNLACVWAEELWLPVTVPTMTQTIKLTVGQQRAVGSPVPPVWVH